MAPTSPSVSIVLPTFNRVEPLRDSIDSILKQTYSDFELIVVDDASSVDTQSVVESFDDARIRYVEHKVNKGASAARNTGIAEAQGDIIAFQDDDDEWLPEKLQRHVDAFQNVSRDVGVVYTGMLRTVGDDESYLPYSGIEIKEGDIRQSIARLNFISTQMAAVRRECFDKVGTFDEELPALQDWELCIRVSKHYRFRYIDEPLVRGEVRSDSISSDKSNVVRAREHIVNKHSGFFEDKSLANHLFFIGHGKMKLGQTHGGRQYLRKAIRVDLRPIYLASCVLSYLGYRIYNRAYLLAKKYILANFITDLILSQGV